MHLTETQINDVVDGALNAGELDAVTSHLETCAACRSEVTALRAILNRLGELPRSIEPQRDLRPAVWAQTDRKTLWHWRYPLAAAAILLIAVSSVLTLMLSRDSGDDVRTVQEIQPATIDLVSIERQYTSEVEELQRALEDNRENLAPETVRILEESLQIIDAAIAEARNALISDPNSNMLGELLRSAYQRKLELLKQAARTSAVT